MQGLQCEMKSKAQWPLTLSDRTPQHPFAIQVSECDGVMRVQHISLFDPVHRAFRAAVLHIPMPSMPPPDESFSSAASAFVNGWQWLANRMPASSCCTQELMLCVPRGDMESTVHAPNPPTHVCKQHWRQWGSDLLQYLKRIAPIAWAVLRNLLPCKADHTIRTECMLQLFEANTGWAIQEILAFGLVQQHIDALTVFKPTNPTTLQSTWTLRLSQRESNPTSPLHQCTSCCIHLPFDTKHWCFLFALPVFPATHAVQCAFGHAGECTSTLVPGMIIVLPGQTGWLLKLNTPADALEVVCVFSLPHPLAYRDAAGSIRPPSLWGGQCRLWMDTAEVDCEASQFRHHDAYVLYKAATQ